VPFSTGGCATAAGVTLPGMDFRAWSSRLDQRAQEQWRRPQVAPLYLCAALVFLIYGLFAATSAVVPVTLAAVWFMLGVLSLVARFRDRE